MIASARTGNIAIMSAETLVLAFAFGWGAWILYRIHQRSRSRNDPTGAIVEPAPKQTAREMPRIGDPGTITFNQIQELRRNSFTPDRNWSREEAALILDAVTYVRAVCRDIAGNEDGPPPLEIQNDLLRFILTEQDIREHIRKWGEERREAGADDFDDDEEPDLPQNRQYDRVRAHATKFFAPASDEPG